jgi:hypothetical protein
VIRRALDRLPDPKAAFDERLRAAGLLEDPPEEGDLPPPGDIAALEQELDHWLETLPGPLDLGQAVIQDRR